MADFFVDPDLRTEILVHVANNLSAQARPGAGGNLILAIEGPTGEGKTFHCRMILFRAGVHIQRFDLTEFESAQAGDPSTNLLERYVAASNSIANGQPSVLLIEDIDLGLSPKREDRGSEIVQYTMNRNLITGALMALCDSPDRVRIPVPSGSRQQMRTETCSRVPILITGNYLSNLYPALLRHGRARLLRWSMSREVKGYAIARIFPTLNHEQAFSLIDLFPEEAIAFWSVVAMEVTLRDARGKAQDLLRHDEMTHVNTLIRLIEERSAVEVSFEDISAAARDVAGARSGMGWYA